MTLRGQNLPPPRNRRQLGIALQALGAQIQRQTRPRVAAPTPVNTPVGPAFVPQGQSNSLTLGAINVGQASAGIGDVGVSSIGGLGGLGAIGAVGF